MSDGTAPAAVDIEQGRLESLISLVWDGTDHYHHTCQCSSCKSTREHLSRADLHFIDHVSETAEGKIHTS